MATGTAAIVLGIAKWAAGIGASVIATDLLETYYDKNKNKIGKSLSNWKNEILETWRINNEARKPSIEIIEKPKAEEITDRTDKEQTSGVQGSYDYTEFLNWLNSAEGQQFINETAPRLVKQQEIDGIQGNYDKGTYQEKYDRDLEAINRLTAKPGDFEFTDDQTINKPLPNPGEENLDEEKTPIDQNKPTQDITDKTDENLGTNTIDWISWAEEEQKKRWEREDSIRKETQEREDTAYQRAVADMQKAGINPNLININPATSGGGITQASGVNLEGLTSQMYIDAEKMQQLIDNAFKEDENGKNRFMEVLSDILHMAGIIMAFKK